MKKILILTITMLFLGLSACGDDGNGRNTSPSETPTQGTEKADTTVSLGMNFEGGALDGGAPNFPSPTTVYLYGSLVCHGVNCWAGDITSVASQSYTTVGGSLTASFPWFINEWFTIGAIHDHQWRVDGMWANINGSGGTQANLTTVCVYGGGINGIYSVPYLAARPALGSTGAFIENYPDSDYNHCGRRLFKIVVDVQNTASYPLTSSVVVSRQTSHSWDPVIMDRPVQYLGVVNGSGDGKVDTLYSYPSGVSSWIWYEYPRPISPAIGTPQMARNVSVAVWDVITNTLLTTTTLCHIIDIDPDIVNSQWAYEILNINNVGVIQQSACNVDLVLGPPTP